MTLTVDDVVLVALTTLVAAAVGGLAGSWLTLKATTRTIKAQRQLTEEDRKVQATFAAEQRALNNREQRAAIARNAAVELLERVVELWGVIPRLPELRSGRRRVIGGSRETRTSEEWRAKEITDVLDLYKHTQRTALFLISDGDLARRYRALGNLAHAFAYGDFGPDNPITNRALVDVENYAKYLLFSLRQFIDGQPLPRHTDPPNLRRPMEDGSNWHPADIPSDWDQI